MSALFVLAPFFAAALALMMRDRVKAIIVFFCYLTVEGLLKLLSGYHPLVHIGADIVLWILVSVWIAKAIAARRPRVPRVPLATILGLYVVWVLMLLFSPYTASLFVGLASLKIHLSMIPLYFIGFVLAEEVDAPRRLIRALALFWIGTFVITIIQYVGGPDAFLDLGAVYRQRASYFHEWRPYGTTSLPGGQSVIAMIALPFGIYLVLRGDHGLKNGIVLATIFGSIAVFLVSGVRQVFLGGLIASLGMIGLQLTRRTGRAARGLVGLAVLGTIAVIAVQQFMVPAARRSVAEAAGIPEIWRERDAFDRFESLLNPETYARARVGGLQLVLDRVREAPFGVGLGRTGSAASALQDQLRRDPFNAMLQDRFGFQDNFFAAMLVETGVPGTLLLTGMLIGFCLLATRLARKAYTPEDSALGALAAGYMLTMLVISWGSQPLMANPTVAVFWLLGGMVAGRLRAWDAGAAEVETGSEPTAEAQGGAIEEQSPA